MTPVEQNYSNIEREVVVIVFVVTRLKPFLLWRWLTLQTDHKPLKYLFAPDEQIPKTASARITRWAKVIMGVNCESKHTPGEQIPHEDAWCRMDINEDASDNNRVCFAINNIYFAQIDLVTRADIKTKLGWNKLFQDIMKRNKYGDWNIVQERKKDLNNTKMHWPYTMESSSVVLFLSFHQNAWVTYWEECNWGISYNDNMVAWHYSRRC